MNNHIASKQGPSFLASGFTPEPALAGKKCRWALLVALFWLGAALAAVLPSGNAQAALYVGESFRGTDAPGWEFITGIGSGPSLTAATGVDNDGEGWLRLTQDDTWQSSFVYYDTPIPTAQGLVFMFDFVTWSATSSVADGFALAIFDANVSPQAGAYGGSLGYAQRSGESGDIPGLAGGVLGIGFDEFGNYSNPTEGRVGGPRRTADAVAIRGPEADAYGYLTGTGSLGGFATGGANTRDVATAHTVRITIPTDLSVTVDWMQEGGDWQTLIDTYMLEFAFPEEVKFGYTGGTGQYTAFHEIRNLSVSAAAAPVPEPGTLALLALGGMGLLAHRRRRREQFPA